MNWPFLMQTNFYSILQESSRKTYNYMNQQLKLLMFSIVD